MHSLQITTSVQGQVTPSPLYTVLYYTTIQCHLVSAKTNWRWLMQIKQIILTSLPTANHTEDTLWFVRSYKVDCTIAMHCLQTGLLQLSVYCFPWQSAGMAAVCSDSGCWSRSQSAWPCLSLSNDAQLIALTHHHRKSHTGWLKIKYPTGEYAISPQPVV